MIRVNLLPWREERRKARRQQFFALAGLVAVLAGAIWFAGFVLLNGYVATQEEKNKFLQNEIAALDKDIAEIKRLKEQMDDLVKRKEGIDKLQTDRALTVRLFNELIRMVPEGVYIKTLKQSGATLSLTGHAQSNARISTLMRNIEESPITSRPVLGEIKLANIGGRQVFEFSLKATLAAKQPAAVEAPKPAPAPNPAAKEGKA